MRREANRNRADQVRLLEPEGPALWIVPSPSLSPSLYELGWLTISNYQPER